MTETKAVSNKSVDEEKAILRRHRAFNAKHSKAIAGMTSDERVAYFQKLELETREMIEFHKGTPNW
jgi:hypothetical protein